MIASTLYAAYIKEREGLQVLEDETGFVIYKVVGTECFIVDIYVAPQFRGKRHGRALVDRLAELEKACTVMTGNIWIKKPGSSAALRESLAHGFEVKRAGDDILLIAKDLMGGPRG